MGEVLANDGFDSCKKEVDRMTAEVQARLQARYNGRTASRDDWRSHASLGQTHDKVGEVAWWVDGKDRLMA